MPTGRVMSRGESDAMAAKLLDGEALASRIREQVRADVSELIAGGHRPKLAGVIAGSPAPGLIYAKSQQAQCQRVGIDYELLQLREGATGDEIGDTIRCLNQDASVTGIILLMPLPAGVDAPGLQYAIDPYKDVEGVSPANIGMCFYDTPIIAPCAALAAVELLSLSGVEIRGAEAVVVGQGAVVGRPITTFLLQRMATVTGCHIATRNLAAHTLRADILVVGVGKPGLITRTHVKPGAVVIDVGVNRITRPGTDGTVRSATVGDVDFDAVREVAGAITPVPGGVGPVTVAMLLRNTVEAARKQLAGRRP